MIPYIYSLLFPIIVFFYLKNKKIDNFLWVFHFFFLLILIGLRNDVGGDWINYKVEFEKDTFFSTNMDPAFDILKYFTKKISNNFFLYNFLIALIFLLPIYLIISKYELRWLIISAIFPICILLLGMGYLRQGIAFSMGILFLSYFKNRNYIFSILFLILSILSHKLSIIHIGLFLIVIVFISKKYFILCFLSVIAVNIYLIFPEIIERNIFFYLGGGVYQSSLGAYPRMIILTLISISILHIFYKKKNLSLEEKFFLYLSFILIILFQLILAGTVFADRLFLYFQILPIFFFSNKYIFNNHKKIYFLNFVISISYFFIWAIFGTFSSYWLPYKFIF